MWYNKIVENITNITDAIDYYSSEISDAKKEVKFYGNLEKQSAALPGLIEYRFNQLQEVEAILEHLNISLRKERSKIIRKFMEHYNRELSVREAEKWIDGEDSVSDLAELVNEIAFVRNQYIGIMKALETKGFQINNVVKLKCAGLDDAEVGKF